MSGAGDSMETKMDIDEETDSKNVQGEPPEMEDSDARLNIEKKLEDSEGGVEKSSTHLMLGGVIGMKVPLPEYSGTPQLTAEMDPEFKDVEKKKSSRKKSTERRKMQDHDEEKSPPVLSKYDDVLSTAARFHKDRITRPSFRLRDEEMHHLERDRSSPHSRRGRTGRNPESGRGERFEDDYYSPRRNDGVARNRPHHEKYKYPDDFDDEDFEDDFDVRRDANYIGDDDDDIDDDDRSHRGNYSPRSFGERPRGGLLVSPAGYGDRNYGPENFGTRHFVSGPIGQGPVPMGPRGSMVGSSGPGSGSMRPLLGRMGPGSMGRGPGQMGTGIDHIEHGQMTSRFGQMGSGPEQMRSGPGPVGSEPGQMGLGPGQMGPWPGQMGSDPGQMGPGPGQMGPGPGQMGPGPGQMGPGPGQMGPGPGQMGPGPGQMGPGPGQMGPGPGQMGPGLGQMGPWPGQMGPRPVQMSPGLRMGPPGGPICGPGLMGPTGPYPPRGPGFGPNIGPPIPGNYSDGYHGPSQGPPIQGFSPVPSLNPFSREPFPPSQGFMPPLPQTPTFSGEVFQTGGFNPSVAMPSFMGMPPQLPPMPPPLTDTSKPPPLTESAEKLIAQGMNPDLAKILDANSKKPYKSESGAGIQKQKKKKKKISYEQSESDEAVTFNMDGMPLLPMFIPLPDEVPLPPEPKKKKKKSKRDKDLENVMFPPMPEEVPTVEGPPPKPVSPPFTVQVPLDPINNSYQLPSVDDLVPQMVSAPQPLDQVQQYEFAKSEDIKDDTQSLYRQSVSSEQSLLTTILPAVQPPSQQVFPINQVEAVHGQLQSTLSQSMPPLNKIQAVLSQVPNVSASTQQPELNSSPLVTSQVMQVLQPFTRVRRSRFDLNWTSDSVNAALPIASVQPVTAVQLPTTTIVQLPVLPSAPLTVTANIVDVNSYMSFGQVSMSGEGKIEVAHEYLNSENKEQHLVSLTETMKHEDMSHLHVFSLSDQQASPNNESSVPSKSELCVEDKFVSKHVDEEDKSMQMDFEEYESHILKVKDETVCLSENKMNKEDDLMEQLAAKEPVTASMLLQKFKQKQLQKSDSKPELSKYPVVVQSPISEKTITDEPKGQSDLKNQGKFTFAIRKLKQLEAEQQEEEKQVLTAVNSESAMVQKTKDDYSKHVEEGTKKEKGLKEQKQTRGDSVSKGRPRKKSRSVSHSKKSKSRSSSKEKIRNTRQRSKSIDGSKFKDSGGKPCKRSHEKRSRSRERRRMSRERSRTKEKSFSVERRSRRSLSKERKKSLSPWRNDRESFRQYGRLPRTEETNSITAESINTRDGSRLRRSLEKGRHRNSSKDREVFKGRVRDREGRDIHSSNRESTDKDRGEKIEKTKFRNIESSKERKRVSKEKSRKAMKGLADSSSDSFSESDSSEEHVKPKKKISRRERERSSSHDKINIKKKEESRYASVKTKSLIGEHAESVPLIAKCEGMDMSEKKFNEEIDQKKAKYVNKKSPTSPIPKDTTEQPIANAFVKNEPEDAYKFVEGSPVASEILQPKPITRKSIYDSDNEVNAFEKLANKESKKDGKLKSLEKSGGEDIDMKRHADKVNIGMEQQDVPMEDKLEQRKDLGSNFIQSRNSQEYEGKENIKRKIRATDSYIADQQNSQESRNSKSKDERPQKRSRNVEKMEDDDDDDNVEHVTKSKWDSESDGNDDKYVHHNVELISSQKFKKETSKSDFKKLEIDISTISQMTLLSKIMKSKDEKSGIDNESGRSDDEDLKVIKKHRKEKHVGKKSKKEKKKKHYESDRDDEDSLVIHKKKKKSKKRKIKYENSDDDFEKNNRKKKDRHLNSDTEKSDVEYKGKEKEKKKSKQDFDGDNSASSKSKSKTTPHKDRRRNSDCGKVEWIPHGKYQSKGSNRKESDQDSEIEIPEYKKKEKSNVYDSVDVYFDKKERMKQTDKRDKYYRDDSKEANENYRKFYKSGIKTFQQSGKDHSEELEFSLNQGSSLKHVHKLSPENVVESVRSKKDKRTLDKERKTHSDSEESYSKEKGKRLIKEPSDGEMSDVTYSKERHVRKRSKDGDTCYRSAKEMEKRRKSKESEMSLQNKEKDNDFNHKTSKKVGTNSKSNLERSHSSDYEEKCYNKSDHKGRLDSKSKFENRYKNSDYEEKESIVTEELSDNGKMKFAKRSDSVSDKDISSIPKEIKQTVKVKGGLKERKEEIREISDDVEKSGKRGRSSSSRSNSRSLSRTKVLKLESWDRKRPGSSSPDVKTKEKTYKKEFNDVDKQTADEYEKKTEIDRRVKSRKNESSSPESHSKKRDRRFSDDRRKDNESLQDSKYGNRSSSRQERKKISDDCHSRNKRDADKQKYCYGRKSATSSSSDQSSSHSSSSDSGSESDERKHYKTKMTSSKNVQAGTSSKMELVQVHSQ